MNFPCVFIKNINNYELAVYGYFGFWKGPGGQEISGTSIFPALNVYGWSLRGQIGSGIGNLEMAWYQSRDDKDGENSMIKNSEMRYLEGIAGISERISMPVCNTMLNRC